MPLSPRSDVITLSCRQLWNSDTGGRLNSEAVAAGDGAKHIMSGGEAMQSSHGNFSTFKAEIVLNDTFNLHS